MTYSVFPAASTTTTKTLNTQIFTAGGTWTYPTSANFDGTVEVIAVGGGGSGGNSARNGGDGTGSNSHVTGGGGGGQVVRKTVSVLGLGNQTVTIGAGGQGSSGATVGGTCGMYSSFGAYTIANAYPDPELRNGLIRNSNGGPTQLPETGPAGGSLTTGLSVVASVSTTGSVTPTLGSYMAAPSFSASAADGIYSDFFIVTSSTSYNIGFSYARGNNNTAVGNLQSLVYWYTSAGTYISSSTLSSSFAAPTTGTAWTAISATVTTPSTAVFGRIIWATTAATATSPTVALNAVFAAPASTSITSALYGLSSGYQWLGAPYKSATVLIDSKSVLAAGGGGGWGVINFSTSSWQALPPIQGFNTGGDAMTNIGSSIGTTKVYTGGCGGGAGGPAENAELLTQYYSTAVIGAFAASTSKHMQMGWAGYFAWQNATRNNGGYDGTAAVEWTTDTNNIRSFLSMGSNGAPINVDGNLYGAGGVGGMIAGFTSMPNYKVKGNVKQPTSQGMYFGSSNASEVYLDAAPNTGNGGNGIGVVGGNGANTRGGHGGSGIVIVKWYT